MDKSPLDEIVIEKTLDGSDTLYVPSLKEHYHSTNGAIQESNHVFIEAGLVKCLQKKDLSILEIGFGTGLNAFLTLKKIISENINTKYTAIELYPLPESIVNNLNYVDKNSDKDRLLFDQLHKAIWDDSISISKNFSILKIKADIIKTIPTLDQKFDLIYFDAFAPDKQPELWTQSVFDQLYLKTKNHGILTTYCAKGIVRRMLQQSGYIVERLPGPPGKREMLRAIK